MKNIIDLSGNFIMCMMNFISNIKQLLPFRVITWNDMMLTLALKLCPCIYVGELNERETWDKHVNKIRVTYLQKKKCRGS